MCINVVREWCRPALIRTGHTVGVLITTSHGGESVRIYGHMQRTGATLHCLDFHSCVLVMLADASVD